MPQQTVNNKTVQLKVPDLHTEFLYSVYFLTSWMPFLTHNDVKAMKGAFT